MDKVFVYQQKRVEWINLGRILHNFDFFSVELFFENRNTITIYIDNKSLKF